VADFVPAGLGIVGVYNGDIDRDDLYCDDCYIAVFGKVGTPVMTDNTVIRLQEEIEAAQERLGEIEKAKEKRGRPKASDDVELAARMRVAARYSGPCAADDLRLADEWEAQARTKQLPSTRTEIGAGGELIDRENRCDPTIDTVAHPDYVTAEASRDRLALASQAGSLSLALDAADTIQAQDGLEKMLVHQMAVLHCGMMRAAARMNEELDAADVIDANKREAANVRACRLAGAISRLSATYQQGLLTLQRKRTGGNQQVTVKHIHQQVNVTQGGQAVVAGDKVMSRTRGRRRSNGGGMVKNER